MNILYLNVLKHEWSKALPEPVLYKWYLFFLNQHKIDFYTNLCAIFRFALIRFFGFFLNRKKSKSTPSLNGSYKQDSRGLSAVFSLSSFELTAYWTNWFLLLPCWLIRPFPHFLCVLNWLKWALRRVACLGLNRSVCRSWRRWGRRLQSSLTAAGFASAAPVPSTRSPSTWHHWEGSSYGHTTLWRNFIHYSQTV